MDEKELYELSYPHHLKWEQQLWVIQKGDILEDEEGVRYLVKERTATSIQGDIPKLTLEKLKEVAPHDLDPSL